MSYIKFKFQTAIKDTRWVVRDRPEAALPRAISMASNKLDMSRAHCS